MQITIKEMRWELSRVCERVDKLSCGTASCPLAYACEVFGNPHTTDAAGVRAMYRIYQHEKMKNPNPKYRPPMGGRY